MAENEKDNKDFEFIKEQVIEKKRKKLKKRLLPIIMTLFLAILFGLVAAVTFALSEPGIYDFLHKEEGAKSQVTFPTPTPELPEPVVTRAPVEIEDVGDDTDTGDTDTEGEVKLQPYPVIQRIGASIDDFTKMYGEIRKVANEVDKSIVDVASTFTVFDAWFNKTVDKTVNTTGVIVADNRVDLLILVSLDKVRDADSIRLRFSDTAYVDAVVQDRENEINLALLAVAKENIPPIYLNNLKVATLGDSTYTLTVGNPVIALGSPNGHTASIDIGIITSKGSWASITDNKLELFNTNIEDNADSDGIIVNLKGEIIGIITRTLKEDVNQEISTAIGISKIQPYIEKMSNQKPRIYFGIKAEDMTESAKQEYTITNGIYVSGVQTDSPAIDAGMKRGDIILSINDETVANMSSFNNIISAIEPDTEINVKIKRTSGSGVKEMELKVVLAAKTQ